MLASELIYYKLINHKVNHAFVYSGGSIMPLIDQFSKNKIKYFINNHEQNCGHAATGYARASGKTGIVAVTSGPGITNMITPLLDAKNDSVPLIVFSGQVSTTSIGQNAFQEAPAVELTKNVTKWSYQIKHENELVHVIDDAFYIANHNKKGPVHIDIPKDIFMKKISYDKINDIYKKVINDKYEIIPDIENVANIINNSNKPILYVGQGCNDYQELLRNFAIIANIPVTTTIHAMGVFDEEHDLSLQFLGMHGNPAANYAMQQADCIIALGSRFDDRTTGNVKEFAPCATNIVHVNIEPSEINKVVKSNHNYIMDCGDFINKLMPYIKYQKREKWISNIKDLQKKHIFKYHTPKNNKLNTQIVIEQIGEYLNKNKKNYIITTGVGNHQMMAAQFIKWKHSKSFISSGSLGVMGVGVPYSIGVKIACPQKTVVVIDGDGSFCHTLGDLQTIMRYKLPIKIAIMNDGHQSMVRAWEKLFFDERYVATELPNNPDFCALAEAYGINSLLCDNINDLESTVEKFVNFDGPILCNFKVNYDLCLPLVAPGKALDNMILFDDYHKNNQFDISDTIAPS
jgi:acetolactate synthase I/II/III large subunit